MLIPLASGRAQQSVGRPAREPRILRTCHEACSPASSEAFTQADILSLGETGRMAADMAVQLAEARRSGGRYVSRGHENTDMRQSWCMICASEIRSGASVVIISIRA